MKGKTLASLLEIFKVTRKELGKAIGYEESTISRYCSGERVIPKTSVPEIIMFFQKRYKAFSRKKRRELPLEIQELMGDVSWKKILPIILTCVLSVLFFMIPVLETSYERELLPLVGSLCLGIMSLQLYPLWKEKLGVAEENND